MGAAAAAAPWLVHKSRHRRSGFSRPAFASSDYFALLPWLFLFWTGFYLYRLRPEIPALPDIRLPGLSVISRHSLLLYLLHQPVLYAALVLLPTIL